MYNVLLGITSGHDTCVIVGAVAAVGKVELEIAADTGALKADEQLHASCTVNWYVVYRARPETVQLVLERSVPHEKALDADEGAEVGAVVGEDVDVLTNNEAVGK